ncbi:hypothetical protein [Nitrosospira sp. Is2]|uniref:hypothetical protein n=1 Tax=Nitrosospira sp. Is2 TaxID=3080532 RepID=UPI0029557850|nr:hypothetical protein [Nitrosospira sp. Is2]WON72763.1 hypothetical protein R5L00_09650 [Nitrosospira sp. Is2]
MATIHGTKYNDNDTWQWIKDGPIIPPRPIDPWPPFRHEEFFPSLKGTKNDDTISGYKGNDKLYGYGGNDTLYGGPGNDDLYGGTGNDTLAGGPGKDTLKGGDGADKFDFDSVSESPAGGQYDTITDFSKDRWEWDPLVRPLRHLIPGDKIDLSTIDANVNLLAAGNQSFRSG